MRADQNDTQNDSPNRLSSSEEAILRRELAGVERTMAGEHHAGHDPDPELLSRKKALEAQLATGGHAEGPRRRLVSTPLSQIRAEPVRWLWRDRIPLGKVTLLDGDPSLGKSTITTDVAARVSTGSPMPDGSQGHRIGPAHVVIISAEDGPSDTIRPRCEAAGANLDRIHLAPFVNTFGGEGSVFQEPWRLPDHVPELTELVRNQHAEFVIIDPVSAVLSTNANANRDQDVRASLRPLSDLAQELGCAIVIVRHLNKTPGTEALYRGMGSIGWIAAVRSALFVAKDPSDPSDKRRVLIPYKSNVSVPGTSLYYEIVADELGRARVAWGGPCSHSARELLAESDRDSEHSDCDEIAGYLKRWVETEGAITCKGARERLSDQGFAVSGGAGRKLVQRAARRVGLITTEPGSFGGARSYFHPDCPPPSVDMRVSVDIEPSGVPTVPTSQNGNLRPSVDIPADMSTLGNGHGHLWAQ